MGSAETVLKASINGKSVRLRRMNQQDISAEIAFCRGLSYRSRYFRFGSDNMELHEENLKTLCSGDECPCRCFIAETEEQDSPQPIAFGRFAMEPSGDCEMTILVADDWQAYGLGVLMTETMIAGARACGMRRMYVSALASNAPMQRLARKCGFKESAGVSSGPVKSLCLELEEACVDGDVFDTPAICHA